MALRLCASKLGVKISRPFICRHASNNFTDNKICLTNDESTFVVWHPKQDFPYECTKPLPEVKIEETDTVLKTQLTPEVMNVVNKKNPELARLELMNITHTCKHRWFPRARDKKAKKTPMQRQYL